MNYEQFVCAMLECTKKKLSIMEVAEKQEILKNNGVTVAGIAIRRREESIAPLIYLDEYYKKYQAGWKLEELAELLMERSRNSPKAPLWDYEAILDFQKVKDQIVYKLINAEKNEKLLQEVPNLPVLDLSIIFYLMIPGTDSEWGSILIRNAHINLWNLPISVLYQCARENTQRLCPHILRPLSEFVPEAGAEECPMLVLSNEKGINGAAALLYPQMPKRIYEYLGERYYLLPSSIHEFLIVPADEGIHPQELAEIVREVNATQIPEEELLSDHIYYFDGDNITEM